MTFNLKFWNNLPQGSQGAIAGPYGGRSRRDHLGLLWRQGKRRPWKTRPVTAVKFIKPDKSFVDAMDNFKKGVVDRAAKWAHDKRGLDEALAKKVIHDYIKTYAKWKKLSEGVIKNDLAKFKQVLTNEVYDKLRD